MSLCDRSHPFLFTTLPGTDQTSYNNVKLVADVVVTAAMLGDMANGLSASASKAGNHEVQNTTDSFIWNNVGAGGSGTNSAISVDILNSNPLYRVMSEKELGAVKESGYLRGGIEGDNYFTDSYYKVLLTLKVDYRYPTNQSIFLNF